MVRVGVGIRIRLGFDLRRVSGLGLRLGREEFVMRVRVR